MSESLILDGANLRIIWIQCAKCCKKNNEVFVFAVRQITKMLSFMLQMIFIQGPA